MGCRVKVKFISIVREQFVFCLHDTLAICAVYMRKDLTLFRARCASVFPRLNESEFLAILRFLFMILGYVDVARSESSYRRRLQLIVAVNVSCLELANGRARRKRAMSNRN